MAAMKVESALDDFLQTDPEFLASRIGFLVWRYQLTRSRKIARNIVRHIEALCRHPDSDDSTITRCEYHRSLKCWRILACDDHVLLEDYQRYVS